MMDPEKNAEIEELRRDYLEELGRTVKTMREHAAHLKSAARVKTSYPLLLYLAHQVKGTAGTVGFPRLSEIARSLADDLEEFLDRDVPVSRAELSRKAVAHVDELEQLISEQS